MAALDYSGLLRALWPLHRTLVSDDSDTAIAMLADAARTVGVPQNQIVVHSFPTGEELSTWMVPKKYTLNRFALTQTAPTRVEAIKPDAISLSIAEYSQPIDREIGYDELRPHLFFSEKRPNAIPFVFKYFYRPNYGFCLPKTMFERLDPAGRFHALIDSEFTDGHLRCLEVVLPGEIDDSILIMSNTCHPHQVNDSLTGAINAMMLIEKLAGKKRRHTLRFGFWPETLGAMGYFKRYFDQRKSFKYALFTEMLGTQGDYALQYSRQGDTLIDRAATFALRRRKVGYRVGRFSTVLRNDERISNGINLDIPSISLSRCPYAEYHTSDDNPGIIDMALVAAASEVTAEIIDIVDNNRTLTPGDTLFGQPFLTRYGLFHDPPGAGGDPRRNLNKIMEDVFSYSDGATTLFEICDRFDYDWNDVQMLAGSLVEKGLFTERV